MEDKTIYLAGPREGDDGQNWRDQVSMALYETQPVTLLDPFVDADKNEDDPRTDAVEQLLVESDLVCAYWTPTSEAAGRTEEVYTAHNREIPIVVWNDTEFHEVPQLLRNFRSREAETATECVAEALDLLGIEDVA